MRIKLVIATRASASDFFKSTATGRSLAFHTPSFVDVYVFPSNAAGLSAVYNKVIRQTIDDPATLVFAHDDLHILDYFFFQRIQEGLQVFDVIGIAGNLRRVPKQPAWIFVDTNFTFDKPEYLSGVVGHGNGYPPGNLSVYGEPRKRVMLLDGLLLAANSETLVKNDLYFDEQFNFHFYDLDFCRQAELKNVSCGTWDLSLIHESGGGFGSDAWRSSYQKYLDKWGD